jgi:serine/threonine protein kinase/tetratricopeptide (TPR) repeat protein
MDQIGGNDTIKDAESLALESPGEAPSIGKLLDGRYLIVRELGRGGFGSVYLASDEKMMSKRVVVKVLHDKEVTNEWSIIKFRQETEALTRVDHPGIVGILDTGELPAGNPYIVMRYVDGVTLRSCITAEGMGLERAARLIKQIGSALAAAHEKGVLHRDLKPENIMLQTLSGGEEQATIIDFGVAKVKNSVVALSTVEPSAAGTYCYMSPEQFRGERVTAASDIYSMGIIAYEMTTGRRPFNPETVGQLAEMQREGVKVKPKDLRPALPEDTQNLILKALSFDPADRFQDARNFADVLSESLIGDREVQVRSLYPQGSTERSARDLAIDPANIERISSSGMATRDQVAPQVRNSRRLAFGALALVLLAAISIGIYSLTTRGKAIDSIAVLPFANVGGNADEEYLSDGISETLINSLSQLKQLRVVARATAFRYKGKEVDPKQVGHDLNVRAVLMGRVRQIGDRLNIQVDLVDATTGAQLWGEEYDRRVSDVLAVKQDIAREVTERLLRLSGEEQKQLVKRDTTNAEAYQFYLKGRYYWNKRTAENLRKAVQQFQQAIDKDPTYTLAYVGLADCYVVMEEYAGSPASETLPQARTAIEHALQLDNSLAEAHASLGKINDSMWQWEEAEKEYRRALELNPNYPTAHHWYSIHLRILKQFDNSMTEIKRAQELDPLSLVIDSNVAMIYLLQGDVNSSIEQSKKVIELNPNYTIGHSYLGLAYLKQQRHPEAITELQKAADLSGRAGEDLANLGLAYGIADQRDQALAILRELEGKYAGREAIGLNLAQVYAGLGEKDQAFAWLEKDFQARSGQLTTIRWYPPFESLRSDTRYADLLHRMGLKP